MLPYSSTIINLLKGVVYKTEDQNWKLLNEYREELKKYFDAIGLYIFLDDDEGYAFLRQREYAEEEAHLPKMVDKRQMSYPVTLLCVLLRKRLLEADITGGDTRIIITKDKIKDMMKIFLPITTNEAKMFDRVNEHINKLVEYGFLRKLKNEQEEYEINRILNAYITADKLQQIEHDLREYAGSYE
ncbi:MAG: DUF4194 domain-containing protein [Candidatus Sericytochromatia bacterium]|nr:DUF4194 domain-containing protein [Candidatus Sericytochromatia bacterium]